MLLLHLAVAQFRLAWLTRLSRSYLQGASTAVLHRDLKTGNIVVDQNPPIDSTTFLMKELVDEHTHYVVIDHGLGKVGSKHSSMAMHSAARRSSILGYCH